MATNSLLRTQLACRKKTRVLPLNQDHRQLRKNCSEDLRCWIPIIDTVVTLQMLKHKPMRIKTTALRFVNSMTLWLWSKMATYCKEKTLLLTSFTSWRERTQQQPRSWNQQPVSRKKLMSMFYCQISRDFQKTRKVLFGDTDTVRRGTEKFLWNFCFQ